MPILIYRPIICHVITSGLIILPTSHASSSPPHYSVSVCFMFYCPCCITVCRDWRASPTHLLPPVFSDLCRLPDWAPSSVLAYFQLIGNCVLFTARLNCYTCVWTLAPIRMSLALSRLICMSRWEGGSQPKIDVNINQSFVVFQHPSFQLVLGLIFPYWSI